LESASPACIGHLAEAGTGVEPEAEGRHSEADSNKECSLSSYTQWSRRGADLD